MQAAAILFFVAFTEAAPKVPTSTPKLLLGRFHSPSVSMNSVKILTVLEFLLCSGLETT